jgi:hypothetical protein
MEVGKKYKSIQVYHTEGDLVVYTVHSLTPLGGAVISWTCPYTKMTNEAIIRKENFGFYREVKEPVVRYVHWLKNKTDGRPWVYVSYNPKSEYTDSERYEFLKTDTVTCEV